MKEKIKQIPLAVIKDAINFKTDALTYILMQYDGYIRSLATISYKDCADNVISYLDDDIYNRLKAKLIYSIVKDFKILSE